MTTVRASVEPGLPYFRLENPPREVDRLLYDELSYLEAGAEFTPQFKAGRWDGRERLYDQQNHRVPIGLLDRTRTLLADAGYELKVIFETGASRSGDPIDTGWRFDYDLREYQEQAVQDVLEAGGGVVAIPTGGGKTVVALRLIHTIDQRAVVFVHTKELLQQWSERVRDVLGVEAGMIGDGAWSEGPITVAMMQTLMADREGGGQRVGDLTDDYGIAVFDEAHRTSAADVMHEIGMEIDVRWRIGLSATPWRRVSGAGLKIEAAVGGEAVRVTAEDLIERGYLAEPTFRYIDPGDYGDVATARPGEKWADVYRRCVELNPARNAAVAHEAGRLAREGYRVLVSVDRIGQGCILTSALSSLTPREAVSMAEARADHIASVQAVRTAAERAAVGDLGAAFLSGEDGTDRRQAVLDGFANGDPAILVSTLLKEGVDLPKLNAIVLAGGGKSDVGVIQRVGRALRPAGGDHAVIADVRDRGKYLGEHFEERQAAFSRYYGRFGPEGWAEPGVEVVREWLATKNVPLDALSVYADPDRERVIIETTVYLDDRWDDFVSVMKSTSAIRYDPNEKVNYVEDSDRLRLAVETGVS